MEKTLKQLRKIFAENADKRICVVGASCIGKTTLLKNLPECLDGDDVLLSLLPEDVRTRIKAAPEPWDSMILNEWKEWHRKTRYNIKPGKPVFGIRVEDCDLIVHLVLDEKEYIKRFTKRGKKPEFLKYLAKTEDAIRESGVPVIVVDVG